MVKRACHNTCVRDESYCSKCSRNPDNWDIRDYYKEYIPTCKHNRDDCIHDPAYIKCFYKDWYRELYGNVSPEEAACMGCRNCKSGEDYDDEDK